MHDDSLILLDNVCFQLLMALLCIFKGPCGDAIASRRVHTYALTAKNDRLSIVC